MSDKIYDIIITGAGPAGCTAAIALQKSDLKIAIIEKESFPRDKICGDSVGSYSKVLLREINPQLEQELLAFKNKTNIKTVKVFSPSNKALDIEFRTIGHCIKRIEFDNWMFEKAKENKNAEIFLQKRIIDIEKNNSIFTVKLSDGSNIKGKMLLGCDGANSIAARKLGDFKINRKHYSVGVRQYHKNIIGLNKNAIEIYFLKDYLPGYFWIFPLANDEANIGFGLLSDYIVKNKIELKKCFSKIISENPIIKERLKNAVAIEEVKGFGLPFGSCKNKISGDGFMLCGDAASLIDPFSGEGIEHAIRSGKLAAEQAIQCFDKNDFSADFIKQYDKHIDEKILKTFKQHYILQKILYNRGWLINLLINLLIYICNIGWIKKRIPGLFY